MDWSMYPVYLERIAGHYFLVAGGAFLLLYILFKSKIIAKKIQKRFPQRSDLIREIGYSLSTMIIFAAVPIFFIENPAIEPRTRYYTEIKEFGWLYFFVIFPILFVLHDTYFYWTHRLMHQRWLFRAFHLLHHRSTNPTPWAAYSFHPLEALVEAGFLPIVLFILPLHPLHLLIFFFFMILYNVYGHLGYEVYPRKFTESAFGKWLNTSRAHNYHHQYFQGNYSLYFLFWDRLLGTLKSPRPLDKTGKI